jgi:hypothetical protein
VNREQREESREKRAERREQRAESREKREVTGEGAGEMRVKEGGVLGAEPLGEGVA